MPTVDFFHYFDNVVIVVYSSLAKNYRGSITTLGKKRKKLNSVTIFKDSFSSFISHWLNEYKDDPLCSLDGNEVVGLSLWTLK